MKIVIIADLHGNYDAWRAFPEDYDELWVLGDLVNYGPEPQAVVAAMMTQASVIVQGNHDYAVANGGDAHWKARYALMAETTRRYTASVLSEPQKKFLRRLPLATLLERDGTTFYLTHATPSHPLQGSYLPASDEWVREIESVSADVLLVGHTHTPFLRKDRTETITEPGEPGTAPVGPFGGELCRLAGWPFHAQVLPLSPGENGAKATSAVLPARR